VSRLQGALLEPTINTPSLSYANKRKGRNYTNRKKVCLLFEQNQADEKLLCYFLTNPALLLITFRKLKLEKGRLVSGLVFNNAK